MPQHKCAPNAIELPTDDPLALIRKAELSKLLGVNPWTVDNWRKRKLIRKRRSDPTFCSGG
jgi:hypothetical protein